MLDLGPQHQKSKYTKIWIVGQKAKKNFNGNQHSMLLGSQSWKIQFMTKFVECKISLGKIRGNDLWNSFCRIFNMRKVLVNCFDH